MNIKVIGMNQVQTNLKSIQQKLNKLPDEAYVDFVQNTPIRTGNARNKTKLRNKKIVANYPYAQQLNQGYSKQSPKGMVEPTIKFLRKRIRQILAGK